jgi:hypothetical protein
MEPQVGPTLVAGMEKRKNTQMAETTTCTVVAMS